jgi:hypothetical protein
MFTLTKRIRVNDGEWQDMDDYLMERIWDLERLLREYGKEQEELKERVEKLEFITLQYSRRDHLALCEEYR